MLSRSSLLALAAVLSWSLSTGTQAASAKDLCIDSAKGSAPTPDRPIVIARNFKIPKKNKCKPIQGVLVGIASAVSGVACTSYDGAQVSFTLTATAPFDGLSMPFNRAYGVRLDVPSLDGYLTVFVPGEVISSGVAAAYDCQSTYPDNL